HSRIGVCQEAGDAFVVAVSAHILERSDGVSARLRVAGGEQREDRRRRLFEGKTAQKAESSLTKAVVRFTRHPANVLRAKTLDGRQASEEIVALPLALPLMDLQARENRARFRRRRPAFFCPHCELSPVLISLRYDRASFCEHVVRFVKPLARVTKGNVMRR